MDTATPAQRPGPQSLVFVDDEPFLREAITAVLKTKGFDVHGATDGLAGLQLIRTLRPAFVILDIILPKIDGSQVCWLLRRDPQLRATPLIAFSGLAPQDLRRFPKLSADAYVAKGPLSVVTTNLLRALQYVAERKPGDLQGGTFGYEGFHPRRLVSEMVVQMRRYAALIQLLGLGVLELDADGRILMANARAAHLLGRREAQLITQPFAALFPARTRRVLQDVLDEVQRARTEATVRVTVALGAKALALGFSGTTDAGEVTGILVTLKPAPAARQATAARAD
jgi:CheY-like chemotaxis protein